MANLASDKPITSESEDVLGLSSFAASLAKSLTEMAPEEGIVISVQGEWGSGKTSAIELTQRRVVILELARERGISLEGAEKQPWSSTKTEWDALASIRRTHIIRFNPWNFSGQENLVRAFFKEVGATIGHPADGAISRAINKMTEHLPSGATLVGGLIGALAGGGAGAGAALGRAAGEGAQRLLGSSETLESAKRELGSALREADKRIIVIIDDLDRLLPSEMRAMFALVKSLGDLPNVLYVLSFDERVVSKALEGGPEPIEPAFLEKIVQVPLQLPPPWQPEVRQLFFQRLNSIIGDATPNDESRWRRVYIDSISSYFQTPRDVARFSNTMQVMWPNVVGDVDLTDLVVLVTLQLFEPKIYQRVFESIEFLAGDSISFEDDKIVAARFEPNDANNQKAAKTALAHLFPRLAKAWNTHVWDGTVRLRKREQRRICTKEYYRNYFLFGRDPDRLSRERIEAALGDQNPHERLLEFVSQLGDSPSRRGAPKVATLLDQIIELVYSKPILSDAVVRALLDLSDELISRKDTVWELFPIDNFERLDSIFHAGLEPLSQDERVQRVNLIAAYDSALTTCTRVIERIAAQHGLFGQEPSFESDRQIPLEDAKRAAGKITERIRKVAKSGRLMATPDPVSLIWAWRRLANPSEVKAWLAKTVKNKDALVRLADFLPDTSYQSSGDGQKTVRYFKAENYKDILDVEDMKSRLKALASKTHATEEVKATYRKFLAAEESGKGRQR